MKTNGATVPYARPRSRLKVRDVMSADVKTLVATTSIDDAARSLTLHHVGGAPVMEHGRVVGVISKSDLVAPRNRSGAKGETTVGQVMTPLVQSVKEGEPLMAAVRLMVDQGIHRAVVTDGKGRLVGIVTAMDVLRALTRGDRVGEDTTEPEDARE